MFELCLESFLSVADAADLEFTPISRYPSITREFSMICPEELDFARIADAVNPLSELIRDVSLLVVYRGEPVKKGKKSVSFRVLLQDYTATLSDADANAVQDKVVKTLGKKFGAELRT